VLTHKVNALIQQHGLIVGALVQGVLWCWHVFSKFSSGKLMELGMKQPNVPQRESVSIDRLANATVLVDNSDAEEPTAECLQSGTG